MPFNEDGSRKAAYLKKSGFKMNGWGGWQNQTPMMKSVYQKHEEGHETKENTEKKESANFMSYDDLVSSNLYKKSEKGKEFTHWGETQDYPDGPTYKKVFTVVKR